MEKSQKENTMQSEKDALIELYAGDAFKNRNNNYLTIGVWRQHFVEFADKLAALSSAEPDELYNADALMNDGGDNRQTAAEEVLTYLLIEVVGAPDDVPYSANRAGVLIEERLKQAKSAPSVAVKPLEWKSGSIQHRQVASVFDRPMYEVGVDNGQWYWLHNWNGLALRRVDSENEAKVAAQADYEARIRSAIE